MKMNKQTKKTRRGNCVSDLTNKKKHQIQRIGIETCFDPYENEKLLQSTDGKAWNSHDKLSIAYYALAKWNK